MSLDTSLPDSGSDTPSGLSRRGLIRNAAGAGAATLAAGALLSAATGIAAAAEPAHQDATPAAAEHHAPASAEETLIVHVRDAKTGEIDIFHGHHHRTIKDRALTAALLRAAG